MVVIYKYKHTALAVFLNEIRTRTKFGFITMVIWMYCVGRLYKEIL